MCCSKSLRSNNGARGVRPSGGRGVSCSDYLLQKRSKEVARAEKKLLRRDLGNYAALAQKLIDRPPDESPEILMQRLCDSVQEAWTEWQSA